MAVTYIAGMFGGMFRMNDLSRALSDAADEIRNVFQSPGKVDADKGFIALNGIFHQRYLDEKMQALRMRSHRVMRESVISRSI